MIFFWGGLLGPNVGLVFAGMHLLELSGCVARSAWLSMISPAKHGLPRETASLLQSPIYTLQSKFQRSGALNLHI